MRQNGQVNIYLIATLFIASLIAAFYLGTRLQKPTTEIANMPTTSISPSPTPTVIPSTKPQLPSSPKPASATSSNNSGQSDVAAYFIGLFPKDLPVYPGAKMASYSEDGAANQGPCMQELLKDNPKCLQVNFKFIKDAKDASVEKIVNWYVSNPTPGWIYRGVYGDQRDVQFGDIYNKTVYYRMEYRYPDAEHSQIEIYYNGPYPISDLSPKP